MRNAGLEEPQAGIKIAGRNIKNLRYADDITQIHTVFLVDETVHAAAKSLQSCPTLWDPMDYTVQQSMEFSRPEYWSG